MNATFAEARPSFSPYAAPVLRRKCACGASGHDCEDCKKKETSLQRRALGAGPSIAPPIVHDVLASPGRPLDTPTRSWAEGRFGHDFSRVRLHDGPLARESAQAVDAAAYTVGQHIVLGTGGGPPVDLLDHELAHTMQQSGAAYRPGTALPVGSPGDSAEREADRMADRPQSREAGTPAGRPAGDPATLRRQPAEDPPVGQPEQDRPYESDPSPSGIEMPVFDIFDPMVIAPDMPGVPDFLRGKPIKLSTLKGALDRITGNTPKAPKNIQEFCARFQMEEGHGRFKGMCCPKFVRNEDKCCTHRRMEITSTTARCCTSKEVMIQGRCVTPPPVVVTPPVDPTTPEPPVQQAPVPIPGPTPLPPVRSTIPFKKDLPASRDGERVLKQSTVDSGKAFDVLAAQLKQDPNLKVQLAGKASSEGTDEYNRDLAGRRAKLVADALVQRGISRFRIADPPVGGSSCELVEDGVRNCGETGASEKAAAGDRLVEVVLFGAMAPAAASPAGGQAP